MSQLLPIHMMVFYEEAVTRDRAQCACSRLMKRLADFACLECSLWKLKFCSDDGIAKMASRTAAQADIILFSLLHGTDLPAGIKGWIEHDMLRSEGTRMKLVALVEIGNAGPSEPSAVCQYLRETTRKARVSFLDRVEVTHSPKSVSLSAVPFVLDSPQKRIVYRVSDAVTRE